MQYAYTNANGRRPGYAAGEIKPYERAANNRPAKEKASLTNIRNIDYAISVTATILVLLGIVMVFSSSYFEAGRGDGDPLYFVKRQALMAVGGFCLMYITSNINYLYIKKFSPLIYLLANVLLVVVQFVPSKIAARGNRAIDIPFTTFSFQPSEIAKIGVILLLSAVISANKDMLKRWPGVFKLLFLTAVSAGLVAWGDMGTAVTVAVIGVGIIFIASPHTIRYIVLGAAGSAGLAAFLFYGDNWRSNRIEAWLDPFANSQNYGMQIVNSLFAVGSGGFFGLGLGMSRQKIGFLPEAHNDMIFSIICEELGMIGAFLIIALFCILIARGFRAAMNAVDLFGSLVASGIAIMFGSQAIINIAVVTNSIPNTGIPLPFISYGGTSLLISMAMIGVLLNISRLSKGTGRD